MSSVRMDGHVRATVAPCVLECAHEQQNYMNELTNKLVDISTVIAATAGLWALAFGWLTYVMAVRQQNEDELLAVRSIVEGLRVELDDMRPWTGAGGSGYAKNLKPEDAPPDWSDPTRMIWKFSFAAIASLSNSPYLFRLRDIIGPFARLNFSISRLFQFYDEYRTFVNSNPGLLVTPPGWYKAQVFSFNYKIHVGAIGGADSDDQMCLYKTYEPAVAALTSFTASLVVRRYLWWFWIGHFFAGACVGAGIVLLIRLVTS